MAGRGLGFQRGEEEEIAGISAKEEEEDVGILMLSRCSLSGAQMR